MRTNFNRKIGNSLVWNDKVLNLDTGVVYVTYPSGHSGVFKLIPVKEIYVELMITRDEFTKENWVIITHTKLEL